MSYEQVAFIHLLTVIPAFFIGTYLMFREKGTKHHRALGKVYMVFMIITAIVSFFMEARVGPKLFNHFGFIHFLSCLVLYAVPVAFYSARKGDIETHKSAMTKTYYGAIIFAGLLAFLPGRIIYSWVFQ